MSKEKLKEILKSILFVFLLVAVPILLALPFSLGFKRAVIQETVMALVALSYLLILLFRITLRDSALRKKNKYREDKEFRSSQAYHKYTLTQWRLFVSAIILGLLTLPVYFVWVR